MRMTKIFLVSRWYGYKASTKTGNHKSITKNSENLWVSSVDICVRGKPKSGRMWKNVRTKRHSSMKKDKGLIIPFKKRIVMKQEAQRIKELDRKLKEERAERKRSKRICEEEKRQRKLENERRSEIVVSIKNVAKLKRMKKRQLRNIVKK